METSAMASMDEQKLMVSVARNIKSRGFMLSDRWGEQDSRLERGQPSPDCNVIYNIGINTIPASRTIMHRLLRREKRSPPTVLFFGGPHYGQENGYLFRATPKMDMKNWTMEIHPDSKDAIEMIRLAAELERDYKVNIRFKVAKQQLFIPMDTSGMI